MNRRLLQLLLASAITVPLLLVPAATALATFAGANGEIAITYDDDASGEGRLAYVDPVANAVTRTFPSEWETRGVMAFDSTGTKLVTTASTSIGDDQGSCDYEEDYGDGAFALTVPFANPESAIPGACNTVESRWANFMEYGFGVTADDRVLWTYAVANADPLVAPDYFVATSGIQGGGTQGFATPGFFTSFAASPTDPTLAFSGRNITGVGPEVGLLAINPRSGATSVVLPMTMHAHYDALDVSPDGKWLLYWMTNLDDTDDSGIFARRIDTGDTSRLRTLPATFSDISAARFSPDGTQVAWLEPDASHDNSLMVAQLTTTDTSMSLHDERTLATPAGSVTRMAWRHVGGHVKGRVVLQSCGETSCRLEPLAEATITAAQPGRDPIATLTDADGRYDVQVGSGAWTITPSLRDAVFDPESRTATIGADGGTVSGMDFRTCGASPLEKAAQSRRRSTGRAGGGDKGSASIASDQPCPPDFEIDAVEVTQGVQASAWFAPGTVTVEGDTVPGGNYRKSESDVFRRATTLVTGKDTLVRVYAHVDGNEGASVKVPSMTVSAYVGGAKVGTLVMRRQPTKLDEDLDPDGARADVTRTWSFTVPPAITERSQVTFVAELTPQKGTECVRRGAKACTANNRWALAGVPFVRTKPLEVTLYPMTYLRRDAGGKVRSVTTSVKQMATKMEGSDLGQYAPIVPGDLRVRATSLTSLDTVIASTRWSQKHAGIRQTGVLADCHADQKCSEAVSSVLLLDLKRARGGGAQGDGLLVYPDPIDEHTAGYAKPEYRVAVAEPVLDTMAHEVLHLHGLFHASSGCNAPIAYPWADSRGSIVGWGIRNGSWYQTMSASDWYDVMSYCRTSNRTWLSNRHWNDLVAAWKTSSPARGRTAARRTQAGRAKAVKARAGIHVTAVLAQDGGDPYSTVDPVVARPTANDPRGTVVVTAYGAGNRRIASVRTTASPSEGGGVETVDVVLPVTSALRVTFARTGRPTAAIDSGRHAPTVRLTSPVTPRRVGPKAKLAVAWRMRDADRGTRLVAQVEASTNGGRTWTTVALTSASRAVLPAGSLPTTKRGLVRVTVTDGLRRASATSAKLVVTGRPPRITRVSPAKATVAAAKGASVTLHAYATDAQQRTLGTSSLRWLRGKRVIARGEYATLRFPKAGRYPVTLVATDSGGARSTLRYTVVVK
jgi:hypothetical protein